MHTQVLGPMRATSINWIQLYAMYKCNTPLPHSSHITLRHSLITLSSSLQGNVVHRWVVVACYCYCLKWVRGVNVPCTHAYCTNILHKFTHHTHSSVRPSQLPYKHHHTVATQCTLQWVHVSSHLNQQCLWNASPTRAEADCNDQVKLKHRCG